MTDQFYYGTKRIGAKPMTRAEYNAFRGWQLPADENGADEGYLVEYQDGGKPNVDGYTGYVSWSPKEQFDKAYRANGNLSFGHAIVALKEGHRVARAGWNGKGMWLKFIQGKDVQIHNNGFGPKNEHDHQWRERVPQLLSWIGMKTADNKFVPWLASQTDILADDWEIV